MPFPELPQRVIYDNRTLVEVICQLRFPRILGIENDAHMTSRFQSKIRNEYPYFSEKQQAIVSEQLGQDLPPEIRGRFPVLPHRKAFDFTSRDKQWTVGLTSNFIALSTSQYVRWEGFLKRLKGPLDALEEVYEPQFFTRTGLRYRNVIKRSSIGLEEIPWSELLNPNVAGILTSTEIPYKSVVGNAQRLEIELADSTSMVRIVHGYVTEESSQEVCYLVDSDFFTEEETEVRDVKERLEYFHARSGRLFRWFITEQLHIALQPKPIIE